MMLIRATACLLLGLTISSAVDDSTLPLPPRFHRNPSMLAPGLCAELIKMAESHGWNMIPDSIGGYSNEIPNPSQDINIFDGGRVEHGAEALFQKIEPHLEKLVDWVAATVGDVSYSGIALDVPNGRGQMSLSEDNNPAERAGQSALPTKGFHTIDWIFLRKYSALEDSQRNHLIGHRDTNMWSVNVPLNGNADFDGGELWFARNADFEESATIYGGSEASHVSGGDLERLRLRGRNSTEFYVPDFEAGTALLHDNRVVHGIAPVTGGSKYSLLFFFDMPIAAASTEPNRVVQFVHRAKSAPPLTVLWAHSPDFDVSLLPESERLVAEAWGFGDDILQINSYVGHSFEAVSQDRVRSTTTKAVEVWTVTAREEDDDTPQRFVLTEERWGAWVERRAAWKDDDDGGNGDQERRGRDEI